MSEYLLKECDRNRFRKTEEVNFVTIEAKNVDNAAHWRGFLTKKEAKITSQDSESIFFPFLK